MLRAYVVCLATVLVLSAGAHAGIGQMEQFDIVEGNLVLLVGGPGSATGGNMATVGHGQFATLPGGTTAMQNENAMLSQSAGVVGSGGLFGVFQGGIAGGAQEQLALGFAGPKAQGQELGVGLLQIALKGNGRGNAGGAQGFVSNQNQTLVGRGGVMNESQFIGAAQYANVSGGGSSGGLVVNALCVTATQLQTGLTNNIRCR